MQTRRLLSVSLLSMLPLVSSCGGTTHSVPDAIRTIMAKPRYANAGANWGLMVMDAKTGEVLHTLDADRLSFTGSVRKIFSVGMALETIGPDHRFETPVYRTGSVDGNGVLSGNLVLVASGDLTLGGRKQADESFAFAEFDHNEAPAFGDAELTPQDPLAALDELAAKVKAAGISSVAGDVVVDDRLFDRFVVPNGKVLISPMVVNENLIDVTVAPGPSAGVPAVLDWRPKSSAVSIAGSATTGAAASAADIVLSTETLKDIALHCIGSADCKGTVSGAAALNSTASIPLDYKGTFSGTPRFVGVFRIEDPAAFARSAFIDALARAGVTVSSPAVAKNASASLPSTYPAETRVATFVSPRYAEYARLVLKVSLNTGANLSLMQVGLAKGQRTRETALQAERALLTGIGIDPASFDFPTNGSGSPDSQATPRAVAKLLSVMGTRPSFAAFRAALPLLGIEGSVAAFGKSLAGKGHIAVKSGATITDGKIVAMNMAGYIETKSGRTLAVAIFVNNAGAITAVTDTLEVFEDEAQIAGILYDMN